MNCNDEDLKAELYSNRAIAYFCSGKDLYIYISSENCVIPASDTAISSKVVGSKNFARDNPERYCGWF